MLAELPGQPAIRREISIDPPAGAPAVEARDVWFSYDGKNQALSGVSLTVVPSGMTMLLGRSGSGKTTLLKLCKGLLRPQSGEIRFGASAATSLSHIAYIPQTLGLVRGMSALDNALAGALARTGALRSIVRSFPKAIVAEARETIASLGISHKADELVYRLSGGERQRVAIARALMQRPSLILADEFVSQLDPITADEILQMMKSIASGQLALLVTTHETDMVVEYADRVAIMAGGRIVHEARGADLSVSQILQLLR